MRSQFVGILLAGLIAGQAHASDQTMIQALDDQFSAAVGKGDVEAIALMYAPDATILPNGGDLVKGQAGARALFGGMVAGVSHLTLKVTETVRMAPDYIREVGVSALITKGDKPQTVAGKYVVVWRKVGGHWRLWTDIWN